MWGHYAEKYTGYCVEYKKEDIVRMCRKNSDYFGEVNYVDNVIEINDNNKQQEKIYQASFTKFSDWAYENEWRMFAVDSQRTRVNESIGKYGKIIESGIYPSKVLIGCKMEDSNKSNLKSWCEDLKIKCVDTRKANDEYRIIEY